MQFTLDSIEHVKACLRVIHKSEEINETPVYISNLENLVEKPDTFYFGVLTSGPDNEKCDLKDENDNVIVSISESTQIIEIFTHIECFDELDAPIAAPLGHFRGYEIVIG